MARAMVEHEVEGPVHLPPVQLQGAASSYARRHPRRLSLSLS